MAGRVIRSDHAGHSNRPDPADTGHGDGQDERKGAARRKPRTAVGTSHAAGAVTPGDANVTSSHAGSSRNHDAHGSRHDSRAVGNAGNPRKSQKPRELRESRGSKSRKPSDKPARTSGTVAGGTRSPHPSGVTATPARSEEGGFVDARALRSEDVVAKTLAESSGVLGLATRPKVIDFTARLKERRAASRRVVVLRVLSAAAGLAVLIALVWVLFFSPMLRLHADQISVAGANEWVSESDVTSIVSAQSGRSLLAVDTGSMTEKMTGIPGVTSAEIKRKFPHGIEVTIKAQRPAAMLKDGSDAMTAVDSKGRVLNSVPGANVQGVPVIEVRNVKQGLKSRSVKETLKVLNTLPETMRRSISKVTAETQDSVRTELDGGAHVIVWGDASDMKLKKAVVDKILADPAVIADKHEIDVSAPLRPVLR